MKNLLLIWIVCILASFLSHGTLLGQTPAENKAQIDQINEKIEGYDKPDISDKVENIQRSLERNKSSDRVIQNKVDIIEQSFTEQDKAIEEAQINIDEIRDSVSSNTTKLNISLAEVSGKIENIEAKTGLGSNDYISRLWVLVAAALVFFMQAGFKVFEFGLVRDVHGDGIGMKNLVDWLIVCIVFYLFGFGIMFGDSITTLPIFGWGDLFLPSADEMEPGIEIFSPDGVVIGTHNGHASYGFEFFLFQLAFAATAATIVSGAMSERTAFIPYILTACFVGLLVYPIFGHWVWGNAYLQSNSAWLAEYDFKDFAGSTVVHSIGAWVALVGIWKLGPRLGRFHPDGVVNTKDFKPFSLGYSVLGIFILWFGWWGFNGGSALKLFGNDIDVASIILNTNVAAAFAGFTAFFHSYLFDKKHVYIKLMGGVLGGLVAITACCNVVSSEISMLIGIMAGLVHNFGFDLMLRMRLDDPVGAIPVHGFCGVLGTLCVCLAEKGLEHPRIVQLGIQAFGVIVAFAFAVSLSWLFFTILLKFTNMRISPREEKYGYLVGEED